MGHTVSHNRLLYRALLASLALHLVLLALIPPLARIESTQNIELLSFVRIQTVRIQTPAPRPEHRAAAPQHAVAAVVSVAHAPAPARRPVSTRTTQPSQQVAAAPVQASVVQSGSVATQPPVTVAPPSTTPQNAPATSRQPVGGYEPLGVNDTPVLDPAVRKSLLALGVHVTLTIIVDGNGRTKHVAFSPALDPSVEQQIQALLASASWDPAVCGGGMTCEGQATITL
ncbi:MAG TPA: hypothetical protein VMG98_04905 [Verrucomicrobiae bacterium]|nr:hypothetical protein [Verrucomicrobiae bacterium]